MGDTVICRIRCNALHKITVYDFNPGFKVKIAVVHEGFRLDSPEDPGFHAATTVPIANVDNTHIHPGGARAWPYGGVESVTFTIGNGGVVAAHLDIARSDGHGAPAGWRISGTDIQFPHIAGDGAVFSLNVAEDGTFHCDLGAGVGPL